METDSLCSTNQFLYIFSDTLARESWIFEWILYSGYRRKIFLSNGDRYFTWTFFSNSGNRHGYEWRNLFLLVESDFLASGNYFLPLSHIFFKESFIPISGNEFFSPKEQHCVLFRAFFPASEKHLNYKKH